MGAKYQNKDPKYMDILSHRVDKKTFPFLEYWIFRYSLTKSIRLLSPVLSP